MSKPVRQRIDLICQELIQKHLDLLLVLMAEDGASVEAQAERMNTLVRCLMGCQVLPTLFENNRRVPMSLDMDARPPQIQANAELLERLPDEDILFAFTRPIATLLQLSPISVGLVLQGRDEKQLKNLYHGAQSKLRSPVIRATSVRAVIERRLTTFVERTRALSEQLGASRPRFSSPASFLGMLSTQKSWPEWDAVTQEDFIRSAIASFSEALSGLSDLPPAEVLLELCWESLDLSPQTFLRHAGRTLRTQNLPASQPLIDALAEVIAPGQYQELGALDTWPAMQELLDAWRALSEHEHETLLKHSPHARPAPMISMLAPPGASIGLCDPEDLPWDHPLVSWSQRETTALRDLLMGFVQSHKALRRPLQEASEASEAEILLVDAQDAQPKPMRVDLSPIHVNFQVIGSSIEMPAHYEAMQTRAYEAALLHLTHQIGSLPENQQLGMMTRLHGAYSGYFPQTKPVWDRRMQSWRRDSKPNAIRRLATELANLLDAPAIFDPFESPDESMPAMMPAFCFIIALSEEFERVPFRIPVPSLLRTAGVGAAPLRLRMIDVPANPDASCRWLCDREIGMGDLQGTPVNLTLNALELDCLRLIAFKK